MKPHAPSYVVGILLIIALSTAAAQEIAYPIASWSRTAALDETKGDATAKGQALFNNWCSACHSRDVRNAPGTRSLQVKYEGALPAALEDREDLTADFVKFFVRDGIATMPFFRPTEISDSELETLAAYLAD